MKKCLIFLIGFVLISSFQHKAQAQNETNKLEELSAEFMRKKEVPGMAVSIYKEGKMIFSKGFGYADIEQHVAVDPANTKFRVASISKTLSADLLIQLVEAGKLNLDAEVQQYIADFPKKQWPITTRQAAGHIAGVRHYRGDEFMSNKFYPTVNDGLEIFKDDNLLFEPGTKYSYSSYGFNLVSAVIEGASGGNFLELMRMNVFDKLGMKNTVPEYNDRIINNRGGYYYRSEGALLNAPEVDNSYKWAGGGFLSTSEDLVLFAINHLSPGYLSKKSLEELTTSQKLVDGSSTGYGLGWSTNTDKKGHHWVGHSGGAVGGTSKMVIYPDQRIIIVVLTNISSARIGDFPHELAWIAME